MKFKIPRPSEIEVTMVKVILPVRYDDEDIPKDFPGREGDLWTGIIDIDTGRFHRWPESYGAANLQMKVVDGGTYILYDPNGNEVARIDRGYVPNGLVPGEFGDYVDLQISKEGIITNWPKHPDISEFFQKWEN